MKKNLSQKYRATVPLRLSGYIQCSPTTAEDGEHSHKISSIFTQKVGSVLFFLFESGHHRWACLLKQQSSITIDRLPIKENKLPFPFTEDKRKFAASVFTLQQTQTWT